MKSVRKLNLLVALLGLWKVLAAFILGYSSASAAFWNAIIIGIVLAVLAAWVVYVAELVTFKWLDWINGVAGIWLIVAPFILGYANITAAMWNDIIVGAVVAVLAIWAALTVGGAG